MPSPPGTIILLVLFVVMVYPKVWLLLFLAFILSKTFQWSTKSASAAHKNTEAEKRKAVSDCINFVGRKHKEAEIAKKNFDETYINWKCMRQESILKTAEIAEIIKKVNNDGTVFQTIAKIVSMGGKIADFQDTVYAGIGAVASVVADVGYSACSAHKVAEMEGMFKEAQRVLKKDSVQTEQLFRVLNEIRTISEAVKECIRKFHSETLRGFLDIVSDFRSFATAVKHIDNINDPVGVEKFFKALSEGVIGVCSDPSLRNEYSSLTTYNPGIKELLITIPEIIVGSSFFVSTIEGVRPRATVPRSNTDTTQTVLAILLDFEDIVSKVSQFNEYPKLSKDLLESKRKLENERDEICELATEINERSGM